MSRPFRIATHLLFIGGTIVIMLLSGSRYSWMREFDSSTQIPPVDAGLDDRTIFTTLLTMAIVATQLMIVATSKNRREVSVSFILVLVAVSIWALRTF